MSRVEFISTADWNAATERVISDPNYTIEDDPRCLYGWGPDAHGSECHHRWGHSCDRPFGHPGNCMPNVEGDRLPCESVRRPNRWDATGRAEANR